jgi:hypothetical protein
MLGRVTLQAAAGPPSPGAIAARAQREFLHQLAPRGGPTSCRCAPSMSPARHRSARRRHLPPSTPGCSPGTRATRGEHTLVPRAGFVIQRLREPPRPDCIEFWLDASMPEEDLRSWLIDMADDSVDVCTRGLFDGSAEQPTRPARRESEALASSRSRSRSRTAGSTPGDARAQRAKVRKLAGIERKYAAESWG